MTAQLMEHSVVIRIRRYIVLAVRAVYRVARRGAVVTGRGVRRFGKRRARMIERRLRPVTRLTQRWHDGYRRWLERERRRALKDGQTSLTWELLWRYVVKRPYTVADRIFVKTYRFLLVHYSRVAVAVSRRLVAMMQALVAAQRLVPQRPSKALLPWIPRLPARVKAPPLYQELHGIHLKERGRSYEHSFKGPWGRLRYEYALEEGQRKKKAMWRHYTRVSRVLPLDVPYVYVALHFQPERTTSSLGGVFGDQYLVVDMLARCVPAGWKVYVKEHPSQFYPPFAGERARHIDFYADLQALPNVELASLEMSSFQLIDCSRAVATVTGTVGWEAVIREKPALMFGSAWYRHCEGVLSVDTEATLRAALTRIEAGYRPDPRRVRLYMIALENTCARAGFGYGTPDEAEIALPHDEAVARLTRVLQQYWQHMNREATSRTFTPSAPPETYSVSLHS